MKALAPLVATVALVVACGNDAGTVTFDTWGEELIEVGIPEAAFADGWSLKYDRFVLALGRVTLRTARDAAPTATMEGVRIFDMVAPGVKPVATFTELPAGPLPFVSYAILVPPTSAELGAGATEEDRQTLVDAGASLHVEGAATKAGVTKRFSWSFAAATLFDECRGQKDGKETSGAVVTGGGSDRVQLTIHGDHLFYDDLQAEDAVLRFDPIAQADGDGDGAVTQEELAAVKLANLPPGLGYGTGSAANVDTLADFVAALARTVGHFRGEGECASRSLPAPAP